MVIPPLESSLNDDPNSQIPLPTQIQKLVLNMNRCQFNPDPWYRKFNSVTVIRYYDVLPRKSMWLPDESLCKMMCFRFLVWCPCGAAWRQLHRPPALKLFSSFPPMSHLAPLFPSLLSFLHSIRRAFFNPEPTDFSLLIFWSSPLYPRCLWHVLIFFFPFTLES